MSTFSSNRSSLFVTLAGFGLAGCLPAGGPATPSSAEFLAPSTAPLEARLEAATSCSDLLTRLRADAVAKLDLDAWRYAESYVEPDTHAVDAGSWGDFADAGAFGGPVNAGGPSAALDTSVTPRHTETNTQVAGVDEADFVETDGQHVYLLHGTDFYVLDAVPLGSIEEAARVHIEGSPIAMFVANGRAVVLSSVFPNYGYVVDPYPGGPLAYDAGPVVDFDGGGAPSPAWDAGAPTPQDAGVDPDPSYWNRGSSYEVKVTVLDVAAAAPVVANERYLEGSYVDARRHGDVVRVVLSSYERGLGIEPGPSSWDAETGRPLSKRAFLRALLAWRDRGRAAIAATPLETFIANDAVVVDGERAAVAPECERFFVPPPGVTATGLARVVALSMASPARTTTITIAGRAGVVYANEDVLTIAQSDYRWTMFTGVASQETALHTFTLSGLATDYEASGKVTGYVQDQFSLDERDGVLRVASTADVPTGDVVLSPAIVWVPTSRSTRVTTFGRTEGTLARLGSTPPMAEGETLEAVRFLGDRAFIVTFRQVDPLFVVDLSTPATPTVVGEIQIPGFSEYIHELDATHLLTIGRETWTATSEGGVALQIFDVADSTAPMLVQKLVLPSTSSDAEWDHEAFVFDEVTGLLAIPTSSYDGAFESALRLFHVSVTDGFADRGAVHHDAYFASCVDATYGYYVCGYSPQMRRGLFIGSYVYSVSYRAVTAHALVDLVTPTGALVLPEPAWSYGPYWY